MPTICCTLGGLSISILNVRLATASSDLSLESSTMALTVHEGVKGFPIVIADFLMEVYKQSAPHSLVRDTN